jgi:3-oxoacyl-[acyl-carrier protein] reductase
VSLEGKVIVVTGGSRGIGKACVLEAVTQGARVVFCSRADGPVSRRVEESAAAIAGRADAAIGLAADVSVEADVHRLFEAVRVRHGGIDAVVSNAAISREGLLVSTQTADWDAVLGVNLTGAFLVAREAVRSFLRQGGGGRLVFIGTLSQNGVSGNASYGASKGGIAGLSRLIAHRYAADGIVSSTVVPGYVETALTGVMNDEDKRRLVDGCPLRRAGSPSEIAAVVTFLLSDRASGANGQTLFAAGGLQEVPA